MKILLSAYACEPNRGSEPEVGWNWALGLAKKGHHVWVLTRANNQKAIEEALKVSLDFENLNFIYFDLPDWMKAWKRGLQGVHIYYLLWQLCIFFVALRAHAKIGFEQIHHVTFVTIRQPSFLGLLGVPFVFGPVAGGERAPYRLRKSYPLQGWIKDGLRDVLNALVWFDPLMHITFMSATHIYVTSPDTQKVLPVWYRKKSSVQLAIGLSSTALDPDLKQPLPSRGGLKVLYVGNLLYLKGIHLALESFAQFLKEDPESRFTLIGSGSEELWLKKRAKKLKIVHAIEWIPNLPRSELMKRYPLFDVFLFPSLHDSGGMVILEAMSCGLPVVAFDLGGPGVLVDNACGARIETSGKPEAKVIAEMCGALLRFSLNPSEIALCGESSKKRVQQFLWSKLIDKSIGCL